MPTAEKKDLLCQQCMSQFTELEVIDRIDMRTGNFMCRDCEVALVAIKEDEPKGLCAQTVRK